MHRSTLAAGVTTLALLALAAGAAAQDLPPVEVARLGKAATVIVQDPSGRASRFSRGFLGEGFPGGGFDRGRAPAPGGFGRDGSRPSFSFTTTAGYCVHPAGLFLTSYRAVSGAAGGPVKVVCRPGLRTQREVEGRVLRTDPAADLALVWAPEAADVPALALGASEDVRERAEVVTCGFPALRPDRRGVLPAAALLIKRSQVLSPPAGKDGGPEMFRVTADPEAGGVVLDGKGKVVGLLGAGEPGEALSVTRLRAFLREPLLLLSVPAVRPADAHKPADFRARLIHPLGDPAPAEAPLEVELALHAGDGPERRVAMAGKAGEYAATAPPVPAPEKKPRLRVAVTYADGTVEGLADEQEVKVGEKSYPLRSLVSLQRLGETMLAVLADGQLLECDAADLPPLKAEVGGAPWSLGLRQARSVRIRPPDEVSVVRCTAVALRGGAEVARQTQTISLARPEDADAQGRQAAAELDRALRSAEGLFEVYAGGKETIGLADFAGPTSARERLEAFARREGLAGGRLTPGQFVKYLLEEERSRERFPSSRGSRGESRFGEPPEGFPGRFGRRGR